MSQTRSERNPGASLSRSAGSLTKEQLNEVSRAVHVSQVEGERRVRRLQRRVGF